MKRKDPEPSRRNFLMKGMALDKEFVVGLLIVIFVFIVALLFFTKVWTIGGNETASAQGTSADCSKWLSELSPCGPQEIQVDGSKYKVIPDKYDSLKKAYNSAATPTTKEMAENQVTAYKSARAFCNCPN